MVLRRTLETIKTTVFTGSFADLNDGAYANSKRSKSNTVPLNFIAVATTSTLFYAPWPPTTCKPRIFPVGTSNSNFMSKEAVHTFFIIDVCISRFVRTDSIDTTCNYTTLAADFNDVDDWFLEYFIRHHCQLWLISYRSMSTEFF